MLTQERETANICGRRLPSDLTPVDVRGVYRIGIGIRLVSAHVRCDKNRGAARSVLLTFGMRAAAVPYLNLCSRVRCVDMCVAKTRSSRQSGDRWPTRSRVRVFAGGSRLTCLCNWKLLCSAFWRRPGGRVAQLRGYSSTLGVLTGSVNGFWVYLWVFEGIESFEG